MTAPTLTQQRCSVCLHRWYPLKTGAVGPRRCPNPACRSTKWRPSPEGETHKHDSPPKAGRKEQAR